VGFGIQIPVSDDEFEIPLCDTYLHVSYQVMSAPRHGWSTVCSSRYLCDVVSL